MDYKKLGENIITWAIPLAVAGILGFLQVYGKDFLTPILLIGLAILLVFLIIYFAVHFLAIREKRWQDNWKIHKEINDRLNALELQTRDLMKDRDINAKINKLQNQISYLEGRFKK